MRLYMLYVIRNTMNEHKFQGRYRIESARLADYDYGSNGLYFVTICTQNRVHYFGEIVTDDADNYLLQPNLIGQRVIDGWLSIPTFVPFVQLDAFQLMPNHLHGIIWICKPDYNDWQPNRFGPQQDNLAAVVRGFKAGVTAFCRRQPLDFGWQARYYDRVVRNDDELNRIRHYIENNPAQWHQDRDNAEGIYM